MTPCTYCDTPTKRQAAIPTACPEERIPAPERIVSTSMWNGAYYVRICGHCYTLMNQVADALGENFGPILRDP